VAGCARMFIHRSGKNSASPCRYTAASTARAISSKLRASPPILVRISHSTLGYAGFRRIHSYRTIRMSLPASAALHHQRYLMLRRKPPQPILPVRLNPFTVGALRCATSGPSTPSLPSHSAEFSFPVNVLWWYLIGIHWLRSTTSVANVDLSFLDNLRPYRYHSDLHSARSLPVEF
jgi:hypothetical protein